MPPKTVPAPKARGWLRLLIVFIVAFDAAAFFQWADGAFQSEFGAHADEAANCLDAITHTTERADAGKGTRAFSAALGGWLSVFGTSRIAALLFMAALAAATATLIFSTVQKESGAWAAAVASLLWLCAPAVRGAYETILPSIFSALLLTASALLWALVMNGGGTSRVSACSWLGRAAMILGGAILAIALATSLGLRSGDGRAASDFLRECATLTGIATAVFALIGALLSRRSLARADAVRTAMLALVAGALLARWMKADALSSRALIVATPALAVLAVRGAITLAGCIGTQPASVAALPRRCGLSLFLLLLLALPADLLHPWQKNWRGFAPAALAIIEHSPGAARVLVVSDPLGEGIFQSEIAMRDRARKITVERGSATLTDPAERTANGKPVQRFLEDEELFTHLISGRIQYIVLDSAVPQDARADYHDQVLRVLEGNVRSFWPMHDSPIIRDGEPMGHPLRIFRVMQAHGVEFQER